MLLSNLNSKQPVLKHTTDASPPLHPICFNLTTNRTLGRPIRLQLNRSTE
ncbi:hypothetical protein HanRHA438_Chr11g0514601 [Helianthus annuus]|uniref:Uncharacterized protein n=1 Tax=Helianthus annuus TaxID=4232 RepID=A0A9K3HRE1_HELAN|nr:hypothetical protein HanXRQr2_Chr11g0501931 [Helianthus annuus]KAJ0502364.1 hypothetical protein HanHA300_Chr11g0412081 [Helianthus annuus]KAJ0518286.1 hypothetical protein HanHA89_Chr11g0435751 [Helianthus annuus]KAJ0686319.1 hypothetical protein HanLR1_Chr11g0413421 [Helianthus annuus]KAJ0690146.1 hypothetical protein HanOQP8_Chr11g0414591 [Helianthus annuus]